MTTRRQILGVTWGDPRSPRTYSGVPVQLFDRLSDREQLAGVADARMTRATDALRGAVAWRSSLRARRPQRDPLWRYLPETIDLLSARFRAMRPRLPEHDAVLQFGVAGVPPDDTPLVAHVEISIQTALESDVFSQAYRLGETSDKQAARAIEGERDFLGACALVWTNSTWTAEGLRRQGVPDDRIRVQAPGCAMPDPGDVERDWSGLRILFVGKEWSSKGGEVLLAGYRAARARVPEARLTVIGCEPAIAEPGVEVIGFLDKGRPEHAERLDRAFREATVFCMPSFWESAGVVYMEAAMYGLPVVMLAGQGREELFPPSMAVALASDDPMALADELVAFAEDPERARTMGSNGREHVLEHFMWSHVGDRVAGFVAEACSGLPRSQEAGA